MTPQEMVKHIKRQAAEVRVLIGSTLPDKVGNEAVEHFKENFAKGGFVDGGLQKWIPSKRLTSKYGDKKNGTLLSSRNNLRDSITVQRVPEGVKIVNNVDYAAAHNEGTTTAGRNRNITLPKRQFIGESKELTEKIKQIIDDEIREIMEG